jgi:hypothetical protein
MLQLRLGQTVQTNTRLGHNSQQNNAGMSATHDFPNVWQHGAR